MTQKEFMNHCFAAGGNWTAMLWSGVENLHKKGDKTFEEVYQRYKDIEEVDFLELWAAIKKHLED